MQMPVIRKQMRSLVFDKDHLVEADESSEIPPSQPLLETSASTQLGQLNSVLTGRKRSRGGVPGGPEQTRLLSQHQPD